MINSCSWCAQTGQCQGVSNACDAETNHVYWIKGEGGSWADSTAWSTGAVPAATDNVHIELNGEYTISLGGSIAGTEIKSLTVGSSCLNSMCLSKPKLQLENSLTITGEAQIHEAGTVRLLNSGKIFSATDITNQGMIDIVGSWSLSGEGTFTNEGKTVLNCGIISMPIQNTGIMFLDEKSYCNRIQFNANLTNAANGILYIRRRKEIVGPHVINDGQIRIHCTSTNCQAHLSSVIINQGQIYSINNCRISNLITVGGSITFFKHRFEIMSLDSSAVNEDFNVNELVMLSGEHKIRNLQYLQNIVVRENSRVEIDGSGGIVETLFLDGGTLVMKSDIYINTIQLHQGTIDCEGHVLSVSSVLFLISSQHHKNMHNCKVKLYSTLSSIYGPSIGLYLQMGSEFTVEVDAIVDMRAKQEFEVNDEDNTNHLIIEGSLYVNGKVGVSCTMLSTGDVSTNGVGQLILRKQSEFISGTLESSRSSEFLLEMPGPHLINKDTVFLNDGSTLVQSNVTIDFGTSSETHIFGPLVVNGEQGEIYLIGESKSVTFTNVVLDGKSMSTELLKETEYEKCTLSDGKLFTTTRAAFKDVWFNAYEYYNDRPEVIFTDSEQSVVIQNMHLLARHEFAKILCIDDEPLQLQVDNFFTQKDNSQRQHLIFSNVNVEFGNYIGFSRSTIRLESNTDLTLMESSRTFTDGTLFQLVSNAEQASMTLAGSLTSLGETTTIDIPVRNTGILDVTRDSALSITASSHMEGTIRVTEESLLDFAGDSGVSHLIAADLLVTDEGTHIQIILSIYQIRHANSNYHFIQNQAIDADSSHHFTDVQSIEKFKFAILHPKTGWNH